MLCQPALNGARQAGSASTGTQLAKQATAGTFPALADGFKLGLTSNSNSMDNGSRNAAASNIGNTNTTGTIFISNNNSHKQINYEKSMTTVTSKLANHRAPSADPPSPSHQAPPTNQSTATTATSKTPSLLATIKTANPTQISINNNANSGQIASKMFDRRQAISMERLNSIQSIRVNFRLDRDSMSTGGGSLSSGGSDSSLDENSSNNDEPPTRSTGLTRSASRVSRFRSAKEFFERLSRVGNNSVTHLQPLRPSERAVRGSVLSRYAPAASRLPYSSNSSLISSSASSPGSQHSSSLTNIVASSAVSTQLRSRPTQTTSDKANLGALESQPRINRSVSHSELPQTPIRNELSSPVTRSSLDSNTSSGSTATSMASGPDYDFRPIVAQVSPSLNSSNSSLDCAGSEGSSRAGSPNDLSRASSSDTVMFLGDNVIVNNGSMLIRRNKQLRIKFDEESTHTFEYPSEGAMLADLDSPTPQQLEAQRTPSPEPNVPQVSKSQGEGAAVPPPPARAPVLISATHLQPGDSNDSGLAETPVSQSATLLGKRPADIMGTNLIYQRKNSGLGLSSYKPSNLLVEVSSTTDIDDRLGVTGLVPAATRPHSSVAHPVAKARGKVDQWSTNNGSIICANSQANSPCSSDSKSSLISKTFSGSATSTDSSNRNTTLVSGVNRLHDEIAVSAKANGQIDNLRSTNGESRKEKSDANVVDSQNVEPNNMANTSISIDRKYLFMLF